MHNSNNQQNNYFIKMVNLASSANTGLIFSTLLSAFIT